MTWNSIDLRSISIGNPQYGANASAVEWKEGLPRYIRITDIDDDGNLKQNDFRSLNLDSYEHYLLEENDFLFARTGSVGRTFLYKKEFGTSVYAGYLIRFKLNKKLILPKFLFYYTKSPIYFSWIKLRSKPGLQSNINGQEYASLEIPLPSPSEQCRIVEILDQADEILKLRKQADEKSEKIIPALFYEMFGDLATNSKNWNMKLFSKMCIEQKKTISANDGNDLSYLGLENIESNTGRIMISDEDAKRKTITGTSFLFNSNNILFGKLRPYLNKVALPGFSGRCSTELVPLLPNDGYTKEYLATILRSDFIVDSLMIKNKGARMPRADMRYLMNLELIDPYKNLISKFTGFYRSFYLTTHNTFITRAKIETIFNVLLSKAFDGSLTSSWREAHMKELLKEMEEQKKYLNKVN